MIWGGDTLSDLSTPQTAKQGSEADKAIISQNPADRLVEKIIELDDAEKIGNILQKTIIRKDISTKTKLAVDKQSGEVVHATKVRQRDLARMDRVSRQTAGTSTLPTPLSAADKTALKQDANSAGEAYSSATDSIIPQNSAKDENGNFDAEKFAKGFIYGLFGSKVTAEQGSKIEQAGAKQEVVKGDGWTMRDGGEAKTDYVIKTDLAPNVRDLSKITTDEISTDLEYLAGKHPEIFDKPSDVFRLVKDIKENPTHFFTNNRLDYALIVKRLKNNKIGKLAIDKQSGEVKHATKVKDKDLKRLAKVSEEKSGNAGIIQTFTRPGSKLENQGLGYQDETIISQKGNLVNEKEANELKSLSKEYDVEQFLKDREDILAKEARYGKTRFSESRIEDNGGVGGWEYKRTPAGYDKNYKADFLITKADVAKIRGGKIDEQGSKIEQAGAKQEAVKGEAPGQHPGANFANEKIINQPGLRLNKSREKLIKNTDVSRLNDEQKSVYDVFVGKRDKVILQGKDLSDLYALEQGGKNAGAKKIMIKHAGIEKTGGLSNDELLNIMDVVRNGKIADDSFELRDEIIRYAYDLKKEGINFRVVIDEFNDGKKIFDYYSDRNFIDYGTTQKRLTGNKTFQSAPMAKDSQGLAFSPYKDDAQRVA